ncbi:PEP-CTERM sorting domain-containing protein [Rubritalea spongiae]|uniref:PEP-CTERM sorting domain-containing protein n=1 Tax=Rubritalea spongiae TaxID=430797 RepID=A0ABW5E6I3_9BACT
MKKVLIPLVALGAALPSYGTIILDFSNFDPNTSVVTSGGFDTVSYGIVANDGTSDIYARLVSSEPATNYSGTSSNTGITLAKNDSITFTLSLYQDASYTNLYNPVASYDWSLMFADIEGGGSNGAHEKLTIATPGTYTLADNNFLSVTTDANGTTFSAQGQSTIANPQPGDTELTTTQAQGAVQYNITDLSQVTFTYAAINSNRTAYVYGGSLTFADGTPTTTTTVTTAVPEPSSTALLGLGGLALIMRRRK